MAFYTKTIFQDIKSYLTENLFDFYPTSKNNNKNHINNNNNKHQSSNNTYYNKLSIIKYKIYINYIKMSLLFNIEHDYAVKNINTKPITNINFNNFNGNNNN